MENDNEPKVWLVTGASRGLGRAICDAVQARGDRLVRTMRTPGGSIAGGPADGEHELVVPLDVTDAASAEAAVAAAERRFGRIDVLVNNAGYGVLGGVEEVGADEARRLLATNVEGVLNVLRAALPGMRRQRSGHVVNISSLGGFSAAAGWGVYNASKFAVEGLSEALAQELAPLGIRVTIVEPGYFRTDFLSSGSLVRAALAIGDYQATVGKMVDTASSFSGRQPGDPARAAAAIVDMVHSGKAPLRLPLGADAHDRIQAKLAAVKANLDEWREVSLSTAFVE